MAHSVIVVARMQAGSDVRHRGCAYPVLQTVQRPGVCSSAGIVHYKEPLKSLDKRAGALG